MHHPIKGGHAGGNNPTPRGGAIVLVAGALPGDGAGGIDDITPWWDEVSGEALRIVARLCELNLSSRHRLREQ